MVDERRIKQRRSGNQEFITHPDRRSGVERRVLDGGTAANEQHLAQAPATTDAGEGAGEESPQGLESPGDVRGNAASEPVKGVETNAPKAEGPTGARFPMMGQHDPAVETAGTKAFVERRKLRRRITDTW